MVKKTNRVLLISTFGLMGGQCVSRAAEACKQRMQWFADVRFGLFKLKTIISDLIGAE